MENCAPCQIDGAECFARALPIEADTQHIFEATGVAGLVLRLHCGDEDDTGCCRPGYGLLVAVTVNAIE